MAMNCPPCSGQCRQGECPRDPPPWLWFDMVCAAAMVGLIAAAATGYLWLWVAKAVGALQ